MAQGIPPQVVFITGYQRSGSTILGNVLGSVPGVCHVGELNYLGHRDNPGDCGCGLPFDSCPLWSRVPELLSFGLDDWRRARENSHRVKHLPARSREWRRRRVLSPYTEMTEELYHVIADVSGARYIVDSTKNPCVGLAAVLAPSVEAFVVHVVRDPRAVANSLANRQKHHGARGELRAMRRRPVLESCLRWAMTNWSADRYLAPLTSRDRFLRIRYEDLMEDPRINFESIATWLGLDPAQMPFVTENEVVQSPSHTVMGNPIRYASGATVLALDTEWKRSLSRRGRLVVSAAALPLDLRYGYPVL